MQKSANVNYPNAAKDVNMMFVGHLREAAAMHDEKWMQRRLAKVRYKLSQQRNPDIEAFMKKVLP